MSTDADGSVWLEFPPAASDHLRIFDALDKYHRAVESCYRRFGRRKYYWAVRRKVRYLEILQEVFPSAAVARRLRRARRLQQWAFSQAFRTMPSE